MADDSIPAAIPWYKSGVFRGFLVAAFSQVIARVASKYHLDVSALAAAGVNPDVLAQIVLDGISTMAGAYALHARATKPMAAIVLTKKRADAINASANGGGNGTSPLQQPPPEKPK